MVFVSGDDRSVPLFDQVLSLAGKEPSSFLFIGLIPGNLPSGHLERFKGSLFKRLGQGLMRCRLANVPWSLRVLESFDPDLTGVEFAKLYQPDQIMITVHDGRESPFSKGFQDRLSVEGTPVDIVD